MEEAKRRMNKQAFKFFVFCCFNMTDRMNSTNINDEIIMVQILLKVIQIIILYYFNGN